MRRLILALLFAPSLAFAQAQHQPGALAPLAGLTASIGGSALIAGACASQTVTVAGAATTMAAFATPVTYPGDGKIWSAYVSSAGTVTVKVCAVIAGTPTASAYNVRVVR